MGKILLIKPLPFIVVFFTFLCANAQNVTIDSVYYDRTRGTINTAISGIKDSNFNADLEFSGAGKTFKPQKQQLRVHLGNNSQQKIVAWDFRKESINDFNQVLNAKAQVCPLERHTPLKNVGLSILWPGLGGKNVRPSQNTWVKGLVGWGLIAAGSYFYATSLTRYDKYKESPNRIQLDKNLDSYNKSLYASYACFGAAAAVWTIDLASILSKNHKARKNAVDLDGYAYIPNKRKSVKVEKQQVEIDTRSYYDIAMEKANNYYSQKNLERAKEYYEKALGYKPNDVAASTTLRLVNMDFYYAAMEKANNCYKSNDKKQAKFFYEQALKMKPDDEKAIEMLGKLNMGTNPADLVPDITYQDDNNNGILDANENSKLKITLFNKGTGYANDLKVVITDDKPDSALKFSTVYAGTIPNGKSKLIEVPIKAGIDVKTAKHRLKIQVLEKGGFDMDTAFLSLQTLAYNPPKIEIRSLEVIDNDENAFARNQPDGKLQLGEKVKIKLEIQNVGLTEASSTSYRVYTPIDGIKLLKNNDDPSTTISDNIGTIASGDIKEIDFYLVLNKVATVKDTLPIYLSINEKIGKGSFSNRQLPIAINQKPSKAKTFIVESDFSDYEHNKAKIEYTKKNSLKANFGEMVDINDVGEGKMERRNSVAVVIGIEKYQNNIPDAPYAENDASLMEEYFKKRFGISEVYIKLNEEVSSSNLKKLFNPRWGDLKKAIIPNETDVFVFYSGHGMPDKDGKKVYLFPNDGVVEGVEDFGYEKNQFYADLNALGAKSVTVILDACFSGSSRSTESVGVKNMSGTKGVFVETVNNYYDYKNFTLINSSSDSQTSLGFDQSKSGLFTYFFCKGLLGYADINNDHKITLGEMRDFVIKNVEETSVKISSGGQTPQFWGDESSILVEY
ncbi:hypothetical protein CYCD_01220 [Tenuifilaceae bacterium CYCD]|nr:hypothetical protein CYCD_01220 [Tenuifilaceae bacterium CYCD]